MENNSLTEIVKSRREAGEGVFSSIGGATREKLKEKLDWRKALPQGGLLTALFPSLKAYKAQKADSPVERIIIGINKDFSVFAKNSKKLQSIANNFSSMKKEVNKLARTQNVIPAFTVDTREYSYAGDSTTPTKLETEKEGRNLFLLLAAVGAVATAVTLGYDEIKKSFEEITDKILTSFTKLPEELFEKFQEMFSWNNIKSKISEIGNDVLDFFRENLSKLFSMDTLKKLKDVANKVISRFLGRETSETSSEMYDPNKERTAGEAEAQQYMRDLEAARRGAAQTDPGYSGRRTPTRMRQGETGSIPGISAAAAFSIRSESGATTKEEMMAKGGQIVDNDPKPGVKSYGIFGMNSGGSIQNFVKDNPQFGLKSNPPSADFDREWTELARSKPEALLSAQIAWHEKYVLDPIRREIKALLPAGVPVDDKLIMFMSDRRNQYGKVQEKEASAFASTATNSTEWIRKVTQYDLSNIETAFSTYLKNNPNNRQGLVNRISKRESHSLEVGSMASETTAQAPQLSPVVVSSEPKQTQVSATPAGQPVAQQPIRPSNTFLVSSNQRQMPVTTDSGRDFKERYATQIIWNNLVNNSGFTA